MKKKNKGIQEIKIDIDELQRLVELGYSWHTWWNVNNHSYYAMCTIYTGMVDGKATNEIIYLHRFIVNAKENEYVDHINRDTLDNRKSNLRITTNDQNTKHRKGKNSNNKSGYRNVSWVDNKWIVQLQVDGKNTCLGRFDDVDEAGKHAEKMRKYYYKDYRGKG